MSMEPYWLKVTGPDLEQAVKAVRLANGLRKRRRVLISFSGDEMHLRTVEMETSITAEGEWPGTGRIAAFGLRPLLRYVASEESVEIRYENEKITIGSYSFKCIWQDISPDISQEQIELPIDAPWPDYLKMMYKYNNAQLVGSGLMPKVEEAHEKAERLIGHAATTLAPLGLTVSDLWRLYESKNLD